LPASLASRARRARQREAPESSIRLRRDLSQAQAPLWSRPNGARDGWSAFSRTTRTRSRPGLRHCSQPGQEIRRRDWPRIPLLPRPVRPCSSRGWNATFEWVRAERRQVPKSARGPSRSVSSPLQGQVCLWSGQRWRQIMRGTMERRTTERRSGADRRRAERRSGTERRVGLTRSDAVDAKERRTALRRKEYRRSLFNRRAAT